MDLVEIDDGWKTYPSADIRARCNEQITIENIRLERPMNSAGESVEVSDPCGVQRLLDQEIIVGGKDANPG
jgi:hypothetical protein